MLCKNPAQLLETDILCYIPIDDGVPEFNCSTNGGVTQPLTR